MKTPKDLTAAVSRAGAKLNELGHPVKYTQALSAIAAYHGFSNREEFLADAKKSAPAQVPQLASTKADSPTSLAQLYALAQSMMTVLDSLADGQEFNDVVEASGITARVCQFQHDLRAQPGFDTAVPPNVARPVEGEVITSPKLWEDRYMQLWDKLEKTMGAAFDDVEDRLIARGYDTNRGGRPDDHLGLRLDVTRGPGTNVTYPFCIEFTLYDGLHDAGPAVLGANVVLNLSDGTDPSLASLSPTVGSSGYATELACFTQESSDWQQADVIFKKAVELLEGISEAELSAAEQAKGLSNLAEVRENARRYCESMSKPDAIYVRFFGRGWSLVLRYLDFERTLAVSTQETYEDALFVAHNLAAHFRMDVDGTDGYADYLVQRWNRNGQLDGVDAKGLKRLAQALLNKGFVTRSGFLNEMTKGIDTNAYQFCIVEPVPEGAAGDVALNIDTSTSDGEYLTESPMFFMNFADIDKELERLVKTLNEQMLEAVRDLNSREESAES